MSQHAIQRFTQRAPHFYSTRPAAGAIKELLTRSILKGTGTYEGHPIQIWHERETNLLFFTHLDDDGDLFVRTLYPKGER